MTIYQGNTVNYGSGGTWRVEIEAWVTGDLTSTTVTLNYIYRVVFSGAVNDSTNQVAWQDPWGSGTISYPFVAGGAASFIPVGGNPNQRSITIQYGSTTDVLLGFSVTGIADSPGAVSQVWQTIQVGGRQGTLPSKPAAPTISAMSEPDFVVVNMVIPSGNGYPITDTAFRLYAAAVGGSPVAADANGSAIASYMFGVSQGTTYYASVQAANFLGWGPESDRTAFTTAAATAPDRPAVPTIGSVTASSAIVSWTAPGTNGSPITGYQVQVDNDPAFGSPHTNTSVLGGPLGVTSLPAGTTHYARVRANSSAGYSAWSVAASFTTTPTVPLAPSIPAATTLTTSSASLSWTPTAGAGTATITGYQLQVDGTSDFASPFYDETVVSPATVSGLTISTPYYARVRALSAQGPSQWSSTREFTVTNAAGLFINVGGVFKSGELWTRVGSTWKIAELWHKVGATWKRIV